MVSTPDLCTLTYFYKFLFHPFCVLYIRLDIFSYSGPSGILCTGRKQNTALDGARRVWMGGSGVHYSLKI